MLPKWDYRELGYGKGTRGLGPMVPDGNDANTHTDACTRALPLADQFAQGSVAWRSHRRVRKMSHTPSQPEAPEKLDRVGSGSLLAIGIGSID